MRNIEQLFLQALSMDGCAIEQLERHFSDVVGVHVAITAEVSRDRNAVILQLPGGTRIILERVFEPYTDEETNGAKTQSLCDRGPETPAGNRYRSEPDQLSENVDRRHANDANQHGRV